MAFSPIPRLLGALLVLAPAMPPQPAPVPRLSGAVTVVERGRLPAASPKPRLLGGLHCVDPGAVEQPSPTPRLLGAAMARQAEAPPEPSPRPRLLGALSIHSGLIIAPCPLPRLLAAILAVQPGALPMASPRPRLLGATLVVDPGAVEQPAVLPRLLGGLMSRSITAPPEYAGRPRLLGALAVASFGLPLPQAVPRLTGGLVSFQPGGIPSASPVPRLLGGLAVHSVPLPPPDGQVPRLLGALMVFTRTVDDRVPIFTSSPPRLNGALVVHSLARVPQYDPTNHVTDRGWRSNDHQKIHDPAQLFDQLHYLDSILNVDHDELTGAHEPIPLSRLAQSTLTTTAINDTGTLADSYTAHALLSVTGGVLFEGYLHSFAQTPASGGLVETLTGFEGSTVYRILHSFSGGVIAGNAKMWRLEEGIDPAGDPVTTALNTYDASAEGEAWSVAHYHQIFAGVAKILASFREEHAADDDLSDIAIDTGFDAVSVDWESGYSVTGVAVVLAAHGDTFPVVLHFAQSSDALVVLRTGYDFTSVYVVTEQVDGSAAADEGVTGRSLIVQVGDVPDDEHPTGSTDLKALAAIGWRSAAAVYVRLRAALVALLARYSLEHSLITGRHALPASRFDGWSVFASGTITASSTIGVRTTTAVGAASGFDHYHVTGKGAAEDSGIATLSVGVESGQVVVIASRISDGDSNGFEFIVYSIPDL